MKKLFVTMLAVAATATSFAQNPDALKQVMSAAKASEAAKIMKEQAGTMTGAERAKAYSHLVDMNVDANADYMKKTLTAKTPEDKANYTTKQYKAAYDAVKYAMEANIADNEPNEKGQVKPKFKKNNASKAVTMRNELVNGGLNSYNNKDYADAEKWFGMFVDSHNNDLFAENETVKKEQNYPDICYYAALAAYFNKDYKKSAKYAQMAQETKDEKVTPDALKLEMSAYDGMKTAGQLDDAGLVKKYKQIYKANPTNSDVFGRYLGALYNGNMKEEADKVLADRLKTDPNDLMANAYLGQNAQEAADKCTDEASAVAKLDEAISAYGKVLAAKPDFDAVKYNLAVCTRGKGVLLKAMKKPYKDVLAKAKTLFQEVQAKDPDEAQFKTKYILSTIDEL